MAQNNEHALDFTKIFETVEFPDAYKISYLANAIVIPTYEDIRKDFGLVRAEYHLLLGLAHYAELTAQDISRMTRRPRNSISRAVHRMLERGFIKRAVDSENRRQAKLSITLKGRKIYEEISKYLVQREQVVLDILSENELEKLRDILRKLASHAAGLKR